MYDFPKHGAEKFSLIKQKHKGSNTLDSYGSKKNGFFACGFRIARKAADDTRGIQGLTFVFCDISDEERDPSTVREVVVALPKVKDNKLRWTTLAGDDDTICPSGQFISWMDVGHFEPTFEKDRGLSKIDFKCSEVEKNLSRSTEDLWSYDIKPAYSLHEFESLRDDKSKMQNTPLDLAGRRKLIFGAQVMSDMDNKNIVGIDGLSVFFRNADYFPN